VNTLLNQAIVTPAQAATPLARRGLPTVEGKVTRMASEIS